MAQLEQSTVRNHLLASLPTEDFAALAPAMQSVELGFRQTLHHPGQRMDFVYFPESGMVSLLAPLEDGQFIEVGLVGREGLLGMPVLLGADRAITEALVQMPGKALRLRVVDFRVATERSPIFMALLLRYMLAHHVQVAQTAACNNQHPVDARLARWLLMTHDRAEGNEFPMTHEFIAMMLGARRPSISVAAAILQRAGTIRYTHGQVTVLDRAALETAACECYGTVRDQFEGLLGLSVG